jgi:endonuclease YncB( thermonuclease family)
MIKALFSMLIGFLIGVFLASSLSWRDIDWDNLKQNPWQETMRLRAIISERPAKEVHSAVITKVLDGDSIVIEGGKEVKLLGIDADEDGEKCYLVAKKGLAELVLGKSATLIRDANDKDQYGNLLRYIQVDGKNINVEMTKEGLVSIRIDDGVTIYKNDLIFAEQFAKNSAEGCKWSVN